MAKLKLSVPVKSTGGGVAKVRPSEYWSAVAGTVTLVKEATTTGGIVLARRFKIALANLVESVWLVTVTVTVAWLAILRGAV